MQEVLIDAKFPDSVLDHIRLKYRTLSTTYKNQCPYHLQNVADLQLLEEEVHLQSSSKKQVENCNIGQWVPLPYDNLFKQGHGTRKIGGKILILGEGGIGKTILCSSIAEDWANGKLFQEFLMVLLLPLDQRKVASTQSFVELLNILYEFDSNTCATVERYLTSNTEENILIIADEWDELCETKYQEGSFMQHLLFGALLPSSSVTIVIMSRPESVSQHTQQSIDRFIRVQGFSKETTESCIQLEFGSNQEKFSCIKEQLEINPLVESMCSVPLNLALICNLLQSCGAPLPSTMTELHTMLVWNLAQLKLNSIRGSTLHFSTYQDLPIELQESWLLLCELAFRNIETSHAALSMIEATRFLSSESEIFGLLKPVSSKGDKVIFSFVSLKFEQYLAAFYLARQPLDMQMEVINGMSSHTGTAFWTFYFGMSKHIDTIMQAVSMLSTLHRTHNDEYLLCHYSFESQSQIVQREVVKTLTASGSALLHCHSAYDCMAIVYVIQNMEEECTVEINFQNCDLKAKQICQLASALDTKSHMIQVKGLDLSNSGLNDSVVVDFFKRAAAAFTSLEKLFLRSCGIGREGLSAILDAMAKSSCRSLVQFDLSFNSLTIPCLELLQVHINCGNIQNTEILILKGSFVEDVSMSFLKCFAVSLSSNCPCLRRLDISGNKLGTLDDPDLSSVISQFTSFGNNFDLRLDDDYMSEVDCSFLTVMEESIRNKGTIDHTIAHGVIVGPGRSGKNTLMKRLMGEGPPAPNSISPSTGVLENVIKVEVKKFCTVAASVKNLKWQRMEYDEEALELMMMTTRQYKFVSKPIAVKYIVQEKLKLGQSVKSLKPTDVDLESKPASVESEKVKPVPAESEANDHPAMDRTEKTNKHVVVYSSDLAPVDIFKKAVKLRRMDALREHLESSWSLYLTNTGGQIEFQEHLPLLVCGPSIFFVTFPLHHDLEKPYDVQYQYPDGSVKKYSSTPTLMQELLQTLATIYALDYASIEYGDTELNLKPKVFFIGTHRDRLLGSESDKVIKEIDKKIQRYVRQTSLFHQGSIQFASERRSDSQLIFTVNNLSEEDNDFLLIRSAVQQTVEKKCYQEFTVQCPSPWLIFSLILRAKHKSSRVLRVEDCLKIAQECGISDHREMTSALSFIHSRLGLVRYFNVDGLNSLVVIDPQVLFDKITDLIVETFISENAEQNEIEDFHERGIISVAVMKKISDRSNSDVQLPFMWITKLLNHLKIAALFRDHDGEKYFFPSILCHVPEPQNSPAVSVLESQANQPLPVLVAFETGFCPRGISGALIKCLMTNEMKSNRRWELLPDKIYRNQVSFYVERCVDVTLKLLPTHLEITVDSTEDVTEEEMTETEVTCREAYTQISKCMKIVTSLYRKCEYYWTFYCTLTECQTHPHPAAIEWDRNRPYKLRCKVSNKRFRLLKGHKVWNIQKKESPGILCASCACVYCFRLTKLFR